ncbi:MAG: hypothetical protein RMJ51_03680 [Candidatus Calescibacterium sp.]|nr:hypothetical protein [Candidatus Calescibacterium sp.]MCX7971719.1 hypothetical protein [bacterium]MDW8195325.1 hypothetical protein [Candidatus Calescibacterium sp.]
MFGLFSKKEPSFAEESPIKMTIIEADKWIDIYGYIEKTDKGSIQVYVPLLSQYMSNNLVPITPEKSTNVNLLEAQKDGTVKLFNFDSLIKDIILAEKRIILEKPSKFREKSFGKIKDLLSNFDLEVEMEIEYNALGVPHTQKGKTHRIFHNGISLFTSIPIPPKTIIEVSVRIPHIEYIEKKKDKFTVSVLESKQIEKKKFETVLNFEKIEESLKKYLLEYSLVNQKV